MVKRKHMSEVDKILERLAALLALQAACLARLVDVLDEQPNQIKTNTLTN